MRGVTFNSIATSRNSMLERTAVESANISIDLARQNLKRQQELWKDGLTTKEALERAQNELAAREADLRARVQEITTREQQIKQEQAGLAPRHQDNPSANRNSGCR